MYLRFPPLDSPKLQFPQLASPRCDHLHIRVHLCLQPCVYKQWRDGDKASHTQTSPTHFSFPSMNAQISQCAKREKNPNKYAHNVPAITGIGSRRPNALRQCALVGCVKLTDAHLDHTPGGSWAKHTHVNTDTHLGSGVGKRRGCASATHWFTPIMHIGPSPLRLRATVLIVEALWTPSLTHRIFH